MEKRTIDTILQDLHELISQKKNLNAEDFIDAALYLEILREGEDEKLLSLQRDVAVKKQSYIESLPKRNVAAGEAYIETTDEYYAMRRQEMKIDRIAEFVRIAKKQGEIRRI